MLKRNDSIEDLISQVKALTKLVTVLTKENTGLKQEVLKLRNENRTLHSKVLGLEKESQKPERYKLINQDKKSDKTKKTVSLRNKSGKKPGGQKGHKGTTLEMVANPDETIVHRKNRCDRCGRSLANTQETLVGRRQVADIPQIKMTITEHQIVENQCNCGCINRMEWPLGVNSPISYGPNIGATVAYLSSRQYIPFKRLKEFMTYLLGVPLSEGTIQNMLKKTVSSLDYTYEKIRQCVQQSKVVGLDETGYHANGIKGWTWAFQTKMITFLCCTNNRGSATIESFFPEGFTESTLVSDCWRAIMKQESKAKQICLAHLLREFIYLREVTNTTLPDNFINLLKRIYRLHRTGIPDDETHRKIKNRLTQLLRSKTVEGSDLHRLQKRLKKYKRYITTCIENFDVPPDNNGTERALRNVKIKMKVSGQFKSFETAQMFAVIRSVIDSGLKNSLNPLDLLRNPDLIIAKLPE